MLWCFAGFTARFKLILIGSLLSAVFLYVELQHDARVEFAYRQAKWQASTQLVRLLVNIQDLDVLRENPTSLANYYIDSLIGDSLYTAQDYASASDYQGRATKLSETLFGSESPQTLKRLGRWIETLYFLDQYQTALPLAERCLNLSRQLYGDDSLETSEHAADLALIYSYSDRPLDALPLTYSALKTRIRELGFLDESTIELLRQFAEVGRDLPLGNERGAQIEEIALALSVESLGWESVRTETILNDIDWFLRQQGDCVEALNYSKVALDLSLKLEGEKSSETANRFHSLGTNYYCVGDLPHAIEFTEKSLEITRIIFGEKHSRVAYLEAELSDWHEQSGHQDLSKAMAKDAISTLDDTMGDSHPNAPDVFDFVGTAALQWDVQWSKQLSLRYLKKMRMDFGDDDIALVDPLINLANAELMLGNLNMGLTHAHRAVDLTIGYAESHHTLPDEDALDALVLAEISVGHQADAIRHAFMALKYAELKSGLNHPYTSHAYQQLATAIRQSQPAIAIALLKRSIQLDWNSTFAIPETDKGRVQNFDSLIEPRCQRLNDWLLRDRRRMETAQWKSKDKSCSAPPTFNAKEQSWLSRYDEVAQKRISLDRPFRLLKTEKEHGNVDEKDLRLVSALENRIDLRTTELSNLFKDSVLNRVEFWRRPDNKTLASMRRRTLTEIDPTAWIHYDLSRDKVHITLVTRGLIKEVISDIDPLLFNHLMQQPFFDEVSLSTLYKTLISPLREALDSEKITAIWIDPSGFISSIPFSALHDGRDYLVKSYTISYVGPGAYTDKHPPRKQAIAAFGISHAIGGFRALPWASKEIEELVTNFSTDATVSITPHLDSDFTRGTLEGEIRNGASILHFATHFIPSPGTELASSLLLGDGSHLSAEALTNMLKSGNVGLVTLSACNTAINTIRPSLQNPMMSKLIDAGASSVVGTLWNVEDHESYEFMTLFYGNLIRSKGSVSQALQKAQIEMSRDHAYNQWAPFILYQK